jgi:hypothetical protein
VSIAKESGRRTERAVVVQGLYDRNSFFIGRIVNGGRDHREGVMDVNDVGFFLVHQGTQLVVSLPVPDGVAE